MENATTKEIKAYKKRKRKACESMSSKIGFYNKTNNSKKC
jgi:hypothetical protein